MTITEAVKDRLEQLAELNGGRITPDIVLEDARSPESPLHSEFEWRDDVAAEKFRVEQARRLIRSVRIDIRTETIVIKSIAYVRDPDVNADDQGYVSVKNLIKDRDAAFRAMNDELGRAMAAAQRAAEIGRTLGFEFEVSPITSAIQDARERLNIESAA